MFLDIGPIGTTGGLCSTSREPGDNSRRAAHRLLLGDIPRLGCEVYRTVMSERMLGSGEDDSLWPGGLNPGSIVRAETRYRCLASAVANCAYIRSEYVQSIMLWKMVREYDNHIDI